MNESDPTEGLPDDLAELLRDQSIIVPQDAAVFEAIANAPADPYTTSAQLCDDVGMVSTQLVADRKEVEQPGTTYLDRMNRLRGKTAWARGENIPDPITEPFSCTGHAHLAGEHIACTSPAHRIEPRDLCRAAAAGFVIECRTDVLHELIAAAEALREVALLSVELDHPTLLRWQRAKDDYASKAHFQ